MCSLPAGERRQWWLSLCDSYPTQAYQQHTNQADDGECRMPGCGASETYDHITCACHHTADAVTQAHNQVWKTVYEAMARVAPKTATMVFDVPMAKSGLLYNMTIAKLSPDGILVDEARRQIHLLEFARTGDNRPDYLSLSRARKERKYCTLQAELQNLYPWFTVTIVPFIIGSRSLLIEEDWTKHWLSLRLPTNALRLTIIDAMVCNQEALTDILAIRIAAIKQQSKKGNG
eukprot:1131496-Rhodomonas_salina.1